MNINIFLCRLSHLPICCLATTSLIMLIWSMPALCDPIHDAVKAGDPAKVKTLLKEHPGPASRKDNNGVTPLHRAAAEGSKDVAASTPTITAQVAQKKSPENWHFPERPFPQTKVKDNCLICDAAAVGDVQKMKLLLRENPRLVASTDIRGYTPLILAVMKGHKDAAELLLANKADAAAADAFGGRPLIVAAFASQKDMFELLMKHTRKTQTILDLFSNALCDAAQTGPKSVIELLIANGADVNAKPRGSTPLHYAATSVHTDVAELLLAHKASINAKDSIGRTPLHNAVMNGNKEVAELLLANKADVNARDNYGLTPLHLAGHKDVAELLLASKADVNAKANNGETSLHAAAADNRKDVFSVLLLHGGHQ
jgi:ankyrin repeat protein